MRLRNCVLAFFAAALMVAAGGAFAAKKSRGPAAREPLAVTVTRILSQQHIRSDEASVVVQAVDEDAAAFELNELTPRNPASTIKLVTTWGALESLGPAFTWKTEIYAVGSVSQGVLNGDLVIKGFGDPFLVTEEFWKLLNAVRAAGIRDIRGNLVLDTTYFDLPPEDPGAFDDRPDHPYNVLPNALLLNFHTVRFEVSAGSQGGARIQMDPLPANLQIANRVSVVDGPCRGNYGVSFAVDDPGERSRIILGGQIPRNCGSYGFARAVLTPETFALGVFQTLWSQLGGSFEGGVRAGRVPQGARLLLAWRSRTLADVLRGLNKFSNNTMARHFLLTAGAHKFGAPATADKGSRAIKEILAGHGLDPTAMEIANGSGLARDTRVTARLLADVLIAAWRSPYMPEFVASLPIAGVDGTMRRRFKNAPEAGRMHVKTGHLKGVSAIAGYVHGADHRTYVVVSIVNRAQGSWGGEVLHDTVLRRVYADSRMAASRKATADRSP
ncbi:MAG: D-alanyl-D-alanine carboxypeptidase/D-alanyl-D-alanine-endopeptidase [Gammaproteobacteria bacterium]